MQVFPLDFFENKRFRVNPKLCFVIMPFTENWSNRTYKILRGIVEKLGYECKRADDYYGDIVLKDIWYKINEASFIIADLTSKNPNVYYELGICHVLGKEIIPLIQKDEVVPFDQLPFRILKYEDNIDGMRVLEQELPKWISNLNFASSPQMMLHKEMVQEFNEIKKNTNKIYLNNLEFVGLQLEGINLSGVTLSDADFSNCNLRKSIFIGAKLIRTDLTETLFANGNLYEANLSEAILEYTSFKSADLRNAILLRAKLKNTNFTNANVENLTIDYVTYHKYINVFGNAKNYDKIIVEK